MPSIFDKLDHLVYATPDLGRTMREVGDLLGVTPSPGGQHPAWGTRNALLALGPQMYLEILGPDPDQPLPTRSRPFDIDILDRPRLVTWVYRADRLEAIVEQAKRVGVDLGSVQARSRRRPDGSTLIWRMTDLRMPREGGVVPYFIHWGDSDHPAQRAPLGCSLHDLRAEHPEPERLKTVLAHLGLDLPVEPGGQPRLLATIAGPRGRVELR